MMERNKLAMVLFVISESIFFLLLICAYVFYHRTGGQGPSAASSLDVLKSGLFSAALLSSSVTVWLAETSFEKQRRRLGGAWLLATILLGAVFLGGQGSEYAHLLREHVTISRNLFGTTFFTLTGFHGFHVLIGLVLLTILLGLATAGKAYEPTAPAVAAISIYWHFVDGVWVAVFSVVYLWKFL